MGHVFDLGPQLKLGAAAPIWGRGFEQPELRLLLGAAALIRVRGTGSEPRLRPGAAALIWGGGSEPESRLRFGDAGFDLEPWLRLGAAAQIWGLGSKPEPRLRAGAVIPIWSRGSG